MKNLQMNRALLILLIVFGLTVSMIGLTLSASASQEQADEGWPAENNGYEQDLPGDQSNFLETQGMPEDASPAEPQQATENIGAPAPDPENAASEQGGTGIHVAGNDGYDNAQATSPAPDPQTIDLGQNGSKPAEDAASKPNNGIQEENATDGSEDMKEEKKPNKMHEEALVSTEKDGLHIVVAKVTDGEVTKTTELDGISVIVFVCVWFVISLLGILCVEVIIEKKNRKR